MATEVVKDIFRFTPTRVGTTLVQDGHDRDPRFTPTRVGTTIARAT